MDKKRLTIVVTLILMLFPITKVFAVCPSDSLSELKTLATNINYDYSYTETNNGAIFQVRFTNVHPKLYIYDDINKKAYTGDVNGEVKIGNLSPGKQYKFIVRSSDGATSSNRQEVTVIIDGKDTTIVYDSGDNNAECQNIDITTKYVNLPYYNAYYKDPLCKGMEQYDICSKWNKNTMTYDNFQEEIQKLKNQGQNDNIKKEKKDEKTLIELIMDFVQQNVILITFSVVLIGIIGILIYRKSKESSFNGW